MLSRTAVAVLVLGFTGAVSTAAIAQETGVSDCLHMQKQVSQALDANQQSPNVGDARDLERTGSQFCQAGFYDQGVKRFARALELLGTASNAPATNTKS
jgi:hypothetical protein